MSRRRDVEAAIDGIRPKRILKGELLISPKLVEKFLGRAIHSHQDKLGFINHFQMDMVVLKPEHLKQPLKTGLFNQGKETLVDHWGRSFINWEDCPYFVEPFLAISQLESLVFPELEDYDFSGFNWYKSESDLFIFGLVDGGFQLTSSLLGFESFLKGIKVNSEGISNWVTKIYDHQLVLAKAMLDNGAQGILLADDFAYQRGLLVAPHNLRAILLPSLVKFVKQIHEWGGKVFLHCDGNYNAFLDDLTSSGIDGIQGFEENSGMELAPLKKEYGDKLSLMGNLEIDLLEKPPSPELFERVRSIKEGLGTKWERYIFATSAGLTERVNLASLEETYSMLKD